MRVLQREPGRTVVLEDDGLTVRKTFHGDDPGALQELARREFQRMSDYSAALEGLGPARCVRPLDLELSDEPSVLMERAAGIPMQDHLASHTWSPELRDRVSSVLNQALVSYVDTFHEPYWDFILRNMYFDPIEEVITFFDFGIPVIYLPALDKMKRSSPLDVSLGGLVASSIFEAGRPRRMARRREHRQAPALAAGVLRRCLADPGNSAVSVDGVHEIAQTVYGLASRGGGLFRRGWYRSFGPLVARPMATLDAVCHPAPPGQGRSSS